MGWEEEFGVALFLFFFCFFFVFLVFQNVNFQPEDEARRTR